MLAVCFGSDSSDIDGSSLNMGTLLKSSVFNVLGQILCPWGDVNGITSLELAPMDSDPTLWAQSTASWGGVVGAPHYKPSQVASECLLAFGQNCVAFEQNCVAFDMGYDHSFAVVHTVRPVHIYSYSAGDLGMRSCHESQLDLVQVTWS